MNYLKIKTDDMLNGDGLRVVIWVSGCLHECKGCFNKESWDFDNGFALTHSIYCDKIKPLLKQDHIQGITISGGEPLHERNQQDLFSLLKEIKNDFPVKDIWVYTGYELDTIPKVYNVLQFVDVIVVGKYIEKLNSPNLPWVGSSNQKVIQLREE